jgi:hypothetical protein
MNATSSYTIPEHVQNALRKAKQVLLLPADDDHRFPRIFVVFDGELLPREPEERQQITGKLYQVLFNHIMTDNPLEVFRCNFTSENTTKSLSRLSSLETVEDSMPRPHLQSDEPPENFYLRPDYVVRIENNCDDVVENENFKALAKEWKKFIAQQRNVRPG